MVEQLFKALASGSPTDGGRRDWMSGALLAEALGVSRSAVWKAAEQLRGLGLDLEALPRQGYRLRHRAIALDAGRIASELQLAKSGPVHRGDCVWITDSTNADLLARPAPPRGSVDFLAAEIQSAGRGRRGRRWLAPPGGALCLSWSRSFDALPAQAGALSLIVGVTALRALRRLGIKGPGLKWPNDLVTPDGKLGGILIELKSEAGGPLHLVVGIGVNLALGPTVQHAVTQSGNRATDLSRLGSLPDRNLLAALLIDEGRQGLAQFERDGFEPFAAEYAAADVLAGRPVSVQGAQDCNGIALGLGADGALLVQTAVGIERILSGDVSVRPS
jgi:BirA family biotin operon repressor/biotin-[acetyl-CoA-carboxylase] ligase